MTHNISYCPAKLLSFIFHPLLIPLYGLAIMLTAPTYLEYLPQTVKRILLITVLLNNVMIPLVMLPFLRIRNIISSYAMENRIERIIPMVMVSVLYLITSYIIYRFQIPVIIKTFVFACTFLAIAVTIVTFWWKISVHSMAMGSLTAMIFCLSFKTVTPLTWYIIGVVLAAGFVLSARLRLGSHEPLQVWIGFLAGLAGLACFMLIF